MTIMLRSFEENISQTGIVGDIGGTNARFSLVTPNGVDTSRQYKCADFESFYDALETYLRQISPSVRKPIAISLGVAGDRPQNGIVKMTSLPWDISEEILKTAYGFKNITLINDFVAVAKSVRYLCADDFKQVGDRKIKPNGNQIAVIGPGTGFGFAAIVQGEESDVILQGAAEDTDIARSANIVENQVFDIIRNKLNQPTTNGLLSGKGLSVLYQAVCIKNAAVSERYTPAEVAHDAVQAQNPHAREALNIFWSLLGRVSGNLASVTGATGGVYIAGGIVPRLFNDFQRSNFMYEFGGKGYSGLTDKIPVYALTGDNPGLIGLRSDLALHIK